jgi:hypothetical protein
MKTRSTSLLASIIVGVLGLISIAFAGNLSPREIEENPALVRPQTPAKNGACNLCAIASNRAYQRSPKVIEENPELARSATCTAEVPVKSRGFSLAPRASTWPRILETR